MEDAGDRSAAQEEALTYAQTVAAVGVDPNPPPMPPAPPQGGMAGHHADSPLDQMKLFDMRKVQPPQFSGRPSDWQEFRFRLWILMEVVGIAALMKLAEDRGAQGEITVEEQHETVQARSRLLYLLLSQSVGGKALTILRSVSHANGLEAWRLLTLEYEPRTVARSTAMLAGILTPKWNEVAAGDFMETILQWEKMVEDYNLVAGVPLGDAVKIAVLTQYAPPYIRKFIQLSPVEYVGYTELREAVRVYLQRARSFDPLGIVTAPRPMDVGEVARGGGAGRGKGKGRGGGQVALPAVGRGKGRGAGRGGRGTGGWPTYSGSWWTPQSAPRAAGCRYCGGKGGAGATAGAGAQQRQQALAASKERVGARAAASSASGAFQGTCLRCHKWGHKAAQCRVSYPGASTTMRKVNEVTEEESYVLAVEPVDTQTAAGGEDVPVPEDSEESEEDVVRQELELLDIPGWARMQLADEEVAEALVALRGTRRRRAAQGGAPAGRMVDVREHSVCPDRLVDEEVRERDVRPDLAVEHDVCPGRDSPRREDRRGLRYFGQDHEVTWLPGDLELTGEEVEQARRRWRELKPCDIMLVAGSLPPEEEGEQVISVLIDSGAYLHVCPPSFAPRVPVEETATVMAQSASGKPLKYYGQKAVDLLTEEGCRLSVVFAVFNVTKPILSAGMMRLRGHSVWLGRNPSLTCG